MFATRPSSGYVPFDASSAHEAFIDGPPGQAFHESTSSEVNFLAPLPPDDHDQPQDSCVDSTTFQYVLLIVILLNTIVIALETMFMHQEHVLAHFEYIELAFTVFYVVEVSFRLFCGGIYSFFCGSDVVWNVVDLVITASAVIDTLLHILYHANKSAAQIGRLFRIFRIFRIARIARIFPICHDMIGIDVLAWVDYLLTTTLSASGKLAVLVCLVIFVFGIMSTHMLWDDENENITQLFGSLQLSMWSLFKIMTLDNWAEDVQLVLDSRPDMRMFFVVFVYIAAIALMSLVPAIFIEMHLKTLQAEEEKNALERDKERKRKQAKMLHLLYKVIDSDISGTVSGAEIQETITDTLIVHRLKDAGLQDEDDLRDVKLKLFEMWTDFFEDDPKTSEGEESELAFEVTEDAFVDNFQSKDDDISLTKLWRVLTATRMRISTDYNELHKLVEATRAEVLDLRNNVIGDKANSPSILETDVEEFSFDDLQARADKAKAIYDQAVSRVEEIRDALYEVDHHAARDSEMRKSERSPYRSDSRQSNLGPENSVSLTDQAKSP